MNLKAVKRVLLFEFECPRGILEAHYDIDSRVLSVYGMSNYRGNEQEKERDGNAAVAMIMSQLRSTDGQPTGQGN